MIFKSWKTWINVVLMALGVIVIFGIIKNKFAK